MNIFYLDHNPSIAAQYHCDKHVVKMILETAQILSTVQYLCGKNNDNLYKATHIKHPCVLWTKSDISHYDWLCKLGLSLCDEYSYRYEKIHKSQRVIEFCMRYNDLDIPNVVFTYPPLCMPDQFKTNCCVNSYRNYYNGAKSPFAKWTKRNIPEWFNARINDRPII